MQTYLHIRLFLATSFQNGGKVSVGNLENFLTDLLLLKTETGATFSAILCLFIPDIADIPRLYFMSLGQHRVAPNVFRGMYLLINLVYFTPVHFSFKTGVRNTNPNLFLSVLGVF